MADAGVVALDPVRLAALESYLAGLADGCLHGAGDVETSLGGTGETADTEVGELRRLADWCRVTGEGVAFRRALIEGLPTALPRPDLVFTSPAAAESEADEVGTRLAAALEEEPPGWAVLSELLSEVARGDHDPAFLAALARRLGPEVLLRLPGLVAASHAAERTPGMDPDDPALGVAQGAVRALMAAPPPPGGGTDGTEAAPAPSLAWRVVRGAGVEVDDEQISLIERAEEDLGFVIDGGRSVSGVVRTLQRGSRVVGSLSPVGGAGLVLDVIDLVDDPDAKDVLALVADALLVAAPATGALAPFAYAAAAVAAVAGFALGKAWDLDDDDRDVKRDDDGDGEATYPSGSPSNPNVDTAGVPLGPGYA